MRVKNLFKTYKLKGEYVEALKGVSFDLPETGMVFVLGKSGCGKSTLLNVLSGLDNFDGGDIVFKGKSLKSFTPAELDNYRNTCCGFVFQEYNLIPELSVGDNIALALQLQGEKEVSDKVKNALNAVGLREYETRKVTELSGGQKQRVAIARSIVKEPQIIFADEPSGALDSETGASIFELLKELSKDKLILIVSHDRESAEKYGDRIIELSDGEVISDTYQGYKESNSEDKFTPRHSKMPLKSALKIGCSNFKYHPIRLIATVLLAVFSFTFFGLSIAVYTFDKVNPFVNEIYSNTDEVNYILLSRHEQMHEEELKKPTEENTYSVYDFNAFISEYILGDKGYFYKTAEDSHYFPKEDFEAIQSYLTDDIMLVSPEHLDIVVGSVGIESRSKSEKMLNAAEASYEHISYHNSGYMTITEKEINKYGFEVIGRLPQQDDEVMIPESNYNMLKLAGYMDKDGIVNEIDSYQDILGLPLEWCYFDEDRWDYKNVTVVGILKTGCNKACSEDNHPYVPFYNNDGMEMYTDIPNHYDFYNLNNEYMFHEKVIVSKDFYFNFMNEHRYYKTRQYVLFELPEDKKEFAKVTSFAAATQKGYGNERVKYNYHDLCSYRIINNPDGSPLRKPDGHVVTESIVTFYNTTLDWYDSVLLIFYQLSRLALCIGIIFFIFTFVFLINFISTSVRSQMKQIGILSALGADRKKIFGIYALSSLILCGVIFMVTLLSVGICILLLNTTSWSLISPNSRSFSLFSLNLPTIAILLSVSLITALLGTIISLRKMRKLSPADIIRKGQIK